MLIGSETIKISDSGGYGSVASPAGSIVIVFSERLMLSSSGTESMAQSEAGLVGILLVCHLLRQLDRSPVTVMTQVSTQTW
jgi:hypothetical protein